MKSTGNSPRSSSRYEIRLAGSGGQGIILAGIMLAEAAVRDGCHVAQSQSYGPEARGGNSICEVVLSDAGIDYPRVQALDVLVALTQEACDRNLQDVKEDALVIVDRDMVNGAMRGRVARLPLRQIARQTGGERSINIAALGALAALCPVVSRESLTAVIAERLPKAREANLKTFEEAARLASGEGGNLEPRDARDEFEI